MRSEADDYEVGQDGWPVITTPPLDTDFEMGFEFRGAVVLNLNGSGVRLKLRTTELSPSVASLATAVTDFLTGRLMVSAMWADEPGGVLLDFAHIGHGAAACVVHEMAMPAWFGGPQAQPPWAPVRGAPKLVTVQSAEIVEAQLRSASAALNEYLTSSSNEPH